MIEFTFTGAHECDRLKFGHQCDKDEDDLNDKLFSADVRKMCAFEFSSDKTIILSLE